MIKFNKMSSTGFANYLSLSIKDYAEEHVKAGNWTQSESIEKSTKEHERLLPDGVDTKDNYLFDIFEDNLNTTIGIFWVKLTKTNLKQTSFIYDFRIKTEFQGKGFGKQTLQALEDWLITMGIKSVSLHVFAHNKIAQKLYKKSGFEITDLMMTKHIVTKNKKIEI